MVFKGGVMEAEKHIQKNEVISNEFLEDKEKEVAFYVLSQINEKGYMKASPNYKWYVPMWFRDSSFTSISLTHNAKFFELKNDKETADKMKDASARLLNFMWKAMNNFSENMDRAIEMPLENPSFNIILNHVPARINENYSIGDHRENKEIGSDNPLYYSDLNRSMWLKQFDSVPLLLIATNDYIKNFGADKNLEDSLHKISKLLPKMIEYMNKIYIAPCSNAWEMDTHQIHVYDVAAIYAGMGSALEIVKYFKNDLKEDAIESLSELKRILNSNSILECFDEENKNKIESSLKKINFFNNNEINSVNEKKVLEYMSNVDKFLKDHFIRNNTLYKAKDVFREDGNFKNGPIQEVDSEELFVFTRFNPPCITEEIQKNTMKRIEDELFNNNSLPIRFKGDTYFYGGRWPLLGLEAANWYINNNSPEKAKQIIDYITKKYLMHGEKIPEQEIVNPASQNDPDEFYVKNNKKVIEDLIWSESAYVDTVLRYLENQRK